MSWHLQSSQPKVRRAFISTTVYCSSPALKSERRCGNLMGNNSPRIILCGVEEALTDMLSCGVIHILQNPTSRIDPLLDFDLLLRYHILVIRTHDMLSRASCTRARAFISKATTGLEAIVNRACRSIHLLPIRSPSNLHSVTTQAPLDSFRTR